MLDPTKKQTGTKKAAPLQTAESFQSASQLVTPVPTQINLNPTAISSPVSILQKVPRPKEESKPASFSDLPPKKDRYAILAEPLRSASLSEIATPLRNVHLDGNDQPLNTRSLKRLAKDSPNVSPSTSAELLQDVNTVQLGSAEQLQDVSTAQNQPNRVLSAVEINTVANSAAKIKKRKSLSDLKTPNRISPDSDTELETKEEQSTTPMVVSPINRKKTPSPPPTKKEEVFDVKSLPDIRNYWNGDFEKGGYKPSYLIPVKSLAPELRDFLNTMYPTEDKTCPQPKEVSLNSESCSLLQKSSIVFYENNKEELFYASMRDLCKFSTGSPLKEPCTLIKPVSQLTSLNQDVPAKAFYALYVLLYVLKNGEPHLEWREVKGTPSGHGQLACVSKKDSNAYHIVLTAGQEFILGSNIIAEDISSGTFGEKAQAIFNKYNQEKRAANSSHVSIGPQDFIALFRGRFSHPLLLTSTNSSLFLGWKQNDLVNFEILVKERQFPWQVLPQETLDSMQYREAQKIPVPDCLKEYHAYWEKVRADQKAFQAAQNSIFAALENKNLVTSNATLFSQYEINTANILQQAPNILNRQMQVAEIQDAINKQQLNTDKNSATTLSFNKIDR